MRPALALRRRRRAEEELNARREWRDGVRREDATVRFEGSRGSG